MSLFSAERAYLSKGEKLAFPTGSEIDVLRVNQLAEDRENTPPLQNSSPQKGEDREKKESPVPMQSSTPSSLGGSNALIKQTASNIPWKMGHMQRATSPQAVIDGKRDRERYRKGI